MADNTASDQTRAALDALHVILDAVEVTALALLGVPDGPVARCPR